MTKLGRLQRCTLPEQRSSSSGARTSCPPAGAAPPFPQTILWTLFALRAQADKDVRAPLTTATLALIPDVFSRVFATMPLALVGYGFANIFSQVVAIFAAVFTIVPAARDRARGKRTEANQQR